jgi:hypothetical protein
MNRERPLSEAESARLATFITAAQAAAADWVGDELLPIREFAAWFDEKKSDRLTASLSLLPSGKSEPDANPPRLFVSMSQDVAREFAERVFVEVGMPSYSNVLGDCVAEFANLVAGRAKALTSETPEHFLLGVPTLEPPPPGEYLLTVLGGEIGEVVVGLKAPHTT